MSEQPDDRWMIVLNPAPGAPPNPDDNPSAFPVQADRADVAAMVAVADRPDLGPGPHTVCVCRPGPGPKLVHLFWVSLIPHAVKAFSPSAVAHHMGQRVTP